MSLRSIILKHLPTKLYLQLQFYNNYHKFLHIRHPKTYAEKLAYLKVYIRNPLLTQLVDKYRVRQFVESIIGSQYLVPLIGVYNSVEEIQWDRLPSRFVLKCNHDSGSTIIHQSNEPFDKVRAIESLSRHLKYNMYYYAREYPYKDVPPLILCEQYLDDGNGISPNDYKILCFNGEPMFIIVDQNRFVDHHRDVYDVNWNKLDFNTDHPQTDHYMDKPLKLDEMLGVARLLSKGFTHVRVDLYLINNRVFFGEMTFTPWGGVIDFKPSKWNYILGDLINITNL